MGLFKTKQFGHQVEDLDETRDLPWWAWFWEQGLGKSKQMIDTAAHLYRSGKISRVLVVAPNGVHANFLKQEVPPHMPDDVPYHGMTYYTKRSKTVKHGIDLKRVCNVQRDELQILVMSYDACCTKAGLAAAQVFLRERPTLMILDESSLIKAPRSERSKAAHTLGKMATYRRIADGTAVAENPFDIYSQLLFLDPNFWRQYGLSSYFVFTTMFGVFVRRKAAAGHQYDDLIKYQNLDYLQKIIKSVSSRYLKEECLDIPPKMYKKLTFELTTKQRQVYEDLKANLRTELENDVDMTATTALTRLLRLQQIGSGFAVGHEKIDVGGAEAPTTPEEAMERLLKLMETPDPRRVEVDLVTPEENPRLQLLLSYLETVHHKAIVWCRFTHDVDLVTRALGDRCMRYDGSTSDKDRESTLDRFRDPSGPQFMCVNLLTLSRGVTLVIAKTVIYYTNDFRLINRLQSEDRVHRIGQDASTMFVDLVAEDTVDEHIVKTLRNKFDIAAMVNGDTLREWIS